MVPREVEHSYAIDGCTFHIHDLGKPDGYRAASWEHAERTRGPDAARGTAIGAINIRRTEVRPFSEKQIESARNLRRPGRHRHRERAVIQGIEERNSELREALEHQTATAEVLGIISRSPTDVQPVLDAIVESAARVCGIDDVVLRLREGDNMVSRAHFGPIPFAASRSVWMRHSFAGCASMARSTFPTSARRTISQRWVPAAAGAPSWSFPFVSRGNSLETDRTSHRGAPLHPGADQAPRNLRRPGRDRHRERPAVQRTQVEVDWSSKLRRVKSWVLSPARRPISSQCSM